MILQSPIVLESPTTRKAGGLDFSAIGEKRQRHGSALIGAGVIECKVPPLRDLKTPNQGPIPSSGTR
jgi:hypothetical protein